MTIASWYDASWTYRKSHIIIGSTNAGTDYQVPITVHYGSGSDSVGNVYCNSHCNADFSDIRFTSNDGTTLLDYWVESYTTSTSALVWVKVSADLGSSAIIYIYYGNASATSASNGDNTFLFFDDMTGTLTDKWTITSGTWAYSDGELVHSGEGADKILECKTALPTGGNVAIEGKVKFSNIAWINLLCWSWRGADFNDAYNCDNRPSDPTSPSQQMMLDRRTTGTDAILGQSSFSWSINTYHLLGGLSYGSTIKQQIDRGNELSATDTTYTGTGWRIRCNISGGATATFDDIRVRKYVIPEPTNSTWGTEETAPPVGIERIINGGFETGDTTGWSIDTGYGLIVTTNPHSGTYCAESDNGSLTLIQMLSNPIPMSSISSFSAWIRITEADNIGVVLLTDNELTAYTFYLECDDSGDWIQYDLKTLLTAPDIDDNYINTDGNLVGICFFNLEITTFMAVDDVSLISPIISSEIGYGFDVILHAPYSNAMECVINGGFEDETWYPWETSNANLNMELSLVAPHSGSKSAHFYGSGTSGDFAKAKQIFTPFIPKSTIFTAGFWYRTPLGDGTEFANLCYANPELTSWVVSIPLTITSDWTYVDLTQYIPDGMLLVYLEFGVAIACDLYIDDVSVIASIPVSTPIDVVLQKTGIIVQSVNLVELLHLDEGSGPTAYDSSGNGNDGTLYGTALPTWVDGKWGKALQFDGVDDNVVVPTLDGYMDGKSSGSICAWFNFSETQAGAAIAGWWGGHNFNIHIDDVGTKISFHYCTTEELNNVITSSSAYNDGQWHFAVGTYDTVLGGILYIDGSVVDTLSANGTLVENSTFALGSYAYSSEGSFGDYFKGKIDEVRAYNRALTQAEITALFNTNEGVGTVPIDVILTALGVKRELSIDTLFAVLGLTKEAQIDVLLSTTLKLEDSIDVLFQKLEIPQTIPIDIQLQKTEIIKETLIDVILSNTISTPILTPIDVVLQKTELPITNDVDAILTKLEITKEVSIDVLFTKLRIRKTYSIDTVFKKFGIFTQAEIDTLFQTKGIVKTDKVDVALTKLGITRASKIDVLLKTVYHLLLPISVDVIIAPTDEGRMTPVKNAMLQIIAGVDEQLQPQDTHVRGDWKVLSSYLEDNYPVVTLRLGNVDMTEKVYGRQIGGQMRGHYVTYAFSAHVWAEKPYQLFDEGADEHQTQARLASALADKIIDTLELYVPSDEVSGIKYFYKVTARESEPERGPQRLTRVIIEGFVIVKRPLG